MLFRTDPLDEEGPYITIKRVGHQRRELKWIGHIMGTLKAARSSPAHCGYHRVYYDVESSTRRARRLFLEHQGKMFRLPGRLLDLVEGLEQDEETESETD